MSIRIVKILFCTGIIIFLFIAAGAMPLSVAAQFDTIPNEGFFVPDCGFGDAGKDDCGVRHLYTLANKIMTFLIWVATLGVVLIIIWYGAMLAMNSFIGDYNSIMQKAKKSFLWAIAGLFLVLGAWLAVEFFFRTLGYEGELFDSAITTNSAAPVSDIPAASGGTPTILGSGTTTNPVTGNVFAVTDCPNKYGNNYSCACRNCDYIKNKVRCKDRNTNCYATDDLSVKLQSLYANRDDWWITEGYPPVVGHSSGCHYDGTCVDVNFYDGRGSSDHTPSPNAIKSFVEAAERQGLRAVYEVPNQTTRRELIERTGLTNKQIIVVEGIKPHFSMYNT